MKQVMMVKFDSPKWRKVDEYKVANPFVDVGFRQVKDVVDLRVFDLLNISRINNNRAEEMLLCIYHILQPDRRIDEGIYNDEIDQYFISGMEKETPAFKWSDRKGNPLNRRSE